MTSSSRTATLSLRFTIVGGGIAGLACAFMLQKAGHQVLVLEKTSGPMQGEGGLRVPPNMHRILLRWGLGPQLTQYAIKGFGIAFKLVESGEKIGAMVFHDEIMRGLGADCLLLQHSDLHDWLTMLATESGATIRYSSNVIGVDTVLGSITLSTQETITSDIIIGADGLSSVVRQYVVGPVAMFSRDGSHLRVFNSSIRAEVIQAHEKLRDLDLLTDEFITWMGDGFVISGHSTHAYENCSLCIVAPLRNSSECDGQIDYVPEFDFGRDTLEPRLQNLIEQITAGFIHPHVNRGPLDRLVDGNCRVILVGVAAHLIQAGQTQNAAIGIEDAATLGSLFSHLRSSTQIPSLLSAFEEIRQTRSAAVLASELDKFAAVSIPACSELYTIRNEVLKSALAHAVLDWDEADEEMLRIQWDDHIQIFDYDADEVVEDWWIKWGRLMNVEQQSQRVQEGISGAEMWISISSVSEEMEP